MHVAGIGKMDARRGHFPVTSAVVAGRHEPVDIGFVCSSVLVPFAKFLGVEWQWWWP